jgi:hypothetical protein
MVMAKGKGTPTAAQEKEAQQSKAWTLKEFVGKPVWDWLQLLVVPLMLALITVVFTWQQNVRQNELEDQRTEAERRLEEQRTQDAALQAYLDQMSTLLIENDLRTAPGDSEVRTLARARTLTVLSSLGPEDKPSVLQFLYESGLILRQGPGTHVGPGTSADSLPSCTPQVGLRGIHSIVSLQGADLRDAPLSGADLTGANLSGADLRHADLAPAFSATQYVPSQAISILQGADLREADLSSADLSNADLCSAKLKDTELSDANLREAALFGAKGVTIDRLVKEAESLDGAMMPNYRMCEELPACKGHGKA